MRNKHTTVFLILFIIIVIVSIFSALYADDTVVGIISTVSTLLGIAGLLYSFKLDRNISEASFLFDLHSSFRSNDCINRISDKLEAVYLGKQVSVTEEDRHDIVEYLTFFEMLGSMEDRGVISISSFDALFGYDFFLAYNNPDVKLIELDTYRMYYTQTHRLAKKWEAYRIKRNYPIPLQQTEQEKEP